MPQFLHIQCAIIHSVGGVKPDGSHWKLTQDKAISYIQDGTFVFYIEKPGGHRLGVIVATSAYGNCLKTDADREQPDKPLSLPACRQTETQRPRLT